MAEENRSVQDRKPNRLITEKSPYLLQHAHNPVDWYPWGPEAFAEAAQRGLPVFLSVGYATCHWCHVMERESFEDPEVAALMNENLVPVKVDREERPDIDGICMTVCQMMTGSGGWPLTIVMTPDKKPFFAGTYLPKQTMAGRVGMVDLIRRIRVLWTEKRQEVERFAGDVTASLIESEARSQTGGTLEASVFSRAFDDLSLRFDPEHGGFSHAPKFPTPQHCLFLFRYWLRYRDSRCLAMAERTLTAMRLGGIWDHLGGGFHRYSTDRHWLVPHFEKMLYDQALLCIAYLEAFQITGKDLYAETARDLLDYVLRDMTSPEGGFFSAEDADSEGEEGKFYVWRADEMDAILAADAPLFREVYGISGSGNFRGEVTGEAPGTNILHLRQDLSAESRKRGATEDTFTQKMAACRARLLLARHQRIRPLKDDKILADWNGLMISAFARAYQVLGDDRHLVAARRAADFLLSRMRTNGLLLHRFREGEAAIQGHADDYAFVIAGLLDLYEASFSLDYLREAIALQRVFLDRFGDDREGGFFFTADDAEKLLIRKKEVYDSALPSANSIALLNLLRLSRMTGDSAPAQEAEKLVAAFSGPVTEHPGAYGYFLCSLDFLFGPSAEIVLSGTPGSPEINAMAAVVRRRFLPNKVMLFRPDIPEPDIAAVAPFTAAQTPVKGSATAYICRNFTCADPVTDPESMLRLLGLPSQAP